MYIHPIVFIGCLVVVGILVWCITYYYCENKALNKSKNSSDDSNSDFTDLKERVRKAEYKLQEIERKEVEDIVNSLGFKFKNVSDWYVNPFDMTYAVTDDQGKTLSGKGKTLKKIREWISTYQLGLHGLNTR